MLGLLASMIFALAVLPASAADAVWQSGQFVEQDAVGQPAARQVSEIRASVEKHCACLKSSVCSSQAQPALGSDSLGFYCALFEVSRVLPLRTSEVWEPHNPELDPPPPRLRSLHQL